ncbi:Aste57867_13205 [Aphanomyces stellatus]|uniref:Aste57867_13205 protein n=1 Tax=Aphanomyces stellatus TaxID=120398 RepID=A0A485KZL3_9STRA|nr:hypothetical protein As57867_013156 [Aphanomyces stellatus]VFT90045.1 Aste57867_13205 [Aphanomyces stellatus]
MSPSTRPRPLRILCLHGCRTNTKILRLQLQCLQDSMGPSTQFRMVNAPFYTAADADLQGDFAGPFYEWYDYCGDKETSKSYAGQQRSLAFLVRQVDELGPFDAVLGFSQGAAMTTMLTAHYLAKKEAVPFKAVALFCGYIPRDGMPMELQLEPNTLKYYLDIPSIHVIGTQDYLYKYGRELVTAYEPTTARLFEHGAGHRLPPAPTYKAMYREIAATLRRMCG